MLHCSSRCLTFYSLDIVYSFLINDVCMDDTKKSCTCHWIRKNFLPHHTKCARYSESVSYLLKYVSCTYNLLHRDIINFLLNIRLWRKKLLRYNMSCHLWQKKNVTQIRHFDISIAAVLSKKAVYSTRAYVM